MLSIEEHNDYQPEALSTNNAHQPHPQYEHNQQQQQQAYNQPASQNTNVRVHVDCIDATNGQPMSRMVVGVPQSNPDSSPHYNAHNGNTNIMSMSSSSMTLKAPSHVIREIIKHNPHAFNNDAKLCINNTGYWTDREHELFEEGLNKYGKSSWVKIADWIGTRNHNQVRSHAQKYFKKLNAAQAKKAKKIGNDVEKDVQDVKQSGDRLAMDDSNEIL